MTKSTPIGSSRCCAEPEQESVIHMSTTEQTLDSPPAASASKYGAAGTAMRFFRQGYGYVLLGILVTIVLGALLSPYFLTANNFRNILLTGSIVSVLAVGQFLVIVTRGIDLSVGATAAMATVISAALLRDGVPMGIAVLATLVCCTAVGLLNGMSVVFARITPFIATLGMLSVVQGLAFVIQGDALITIDNASFTDLFNGKLFGIQTQLFVFLGVTLVFGFVMRWTTFGRQLYAIGGNPEAARLSGLPIRRDLLAAYSLSGFLAGLAGLMLAAQLSQGSSLLGQGYELDAIAAAVVGGASLFGGTGNPVTAVLGGLLIGIISNIMNLRNIQAEPQLIIQGLLILVAVYLTSGGAGDIGKRMQSLFIGQRRDGDAPPPQDSSNAVTAATK
jgi:ribose transport system permease protein